MTRQRKKFGREQKLEAVRKIENGEQTLSEVGRELGVAALQENGVRFIFLARPARAPRMKESE